MIADCCLLIDEPNGICRVSINNQGFAPRQSKALAGKGALPEVIPFQYQLPDAR
jgi:hypothetical protein